MALGFGFNKAKVLASAEKNVQQGKLQNAINDYLKVNKEDPKDLTVLNTIGDLYSRLGKNEDAVVCFKKVGEQYASGGFTVKAIAMYKKIAKVKPGVAEHLLRLAELYTQQGLYNDARANYMQVADAYMKAADLPSATGIFQKMLELDPENAAMQARLAELYVRTGKKKEAKQIFLTAAQSLYMRGSLEAADDALSKVLDMEPTNGVALALSGQIAVDLGKPADAVKLLEQLADLDSRPEALHALLRARLQQNQNAEAEPLARKLLSVHNDVSGILAYAEALLNANEFEPALRVYRDHADRLLAANASGTMEKLATVIGRVKENAGALDILLQLYRQAGDAAHIAEVTELLAHACVQAGELERARDLYKQLADAEPENPTHLQHYKQILGKLGQDSAARPMTAEQGAQAALVVDEVEMTAGQIEQNYPDEIAEAVKAALTEAELFDSYNQPQKAIPVLQAALQKAPRDVVINQRLASLYARADRFADAAACCQLLAEIYAVAGRSGDAKQYADMGAKYRQQGAPAPAPAFDVTPQPAPVADFSIEVTPPPAAPEPVAAAPVAAPPAAAAAPPSHEEIDLSDEWMAHEEPAAVQAPNVREIVDEARFYLSQGMVAEGQSAYARAAALAPDDADVRALAEQLKPKQAPAAPPPAPAAPAAAAFEVARPPAPAHMEVEATMALPVTPAIAKEPPATKPAAQFGAVEAPAQPAASAKPIASMGDFALDLDQSLGDDFSLGTPAPKPVAQAAAAPTPAAPPAPKPAPPAAKPAPPPVAAAPPPPPAPPAAAAAADAHSMLSDMFEEFKEDVEQATPEDDDPDTHYNLGVAFKEMGLLDEAIGELQRVCQALDRGKPFSQAVQAYTWLASCFVERGVPQAAVKWYERALKAPGVDSDSVLAIQYELGSAHEAAGDKKSALQQFMTVYASNIDYRDVADRIKALKA